MTSTTMLQILAITQQPELAGRVQSSLSGLPGAVHVGAAPTCAEAMRGLNARPALVVAEVDTLLQPGWEACRDALAHRVSSLPLITLVGEGTAAGQQATLLLRGNGVVTLDALDEALLPAAERLLGNVLLVGEVSEHIAQAASHSSPVGEAAFDRAIERLQAQPGAAPFKPLTPASTGGPPVFLRGLRLLGGGSLSASTGEQYRTACSQNCGGHFCGLKVTVRDGRVEQVEPADFPDSRYRRLCLKGISHLQLATHPERLRQPLKRVGARGEGYWEAISWEQALDEITRRMRVIAGQYGPESMMFFSYGGQLSALNGMSGVYLRLASRLGASATSIEQWGADTAVPSGIEETFGRGTGVVANDYTDLPNSRLVLIWGADPVRSRVNWWPFFAQARRAGTKLVTIDPKYSDTASKSDEWVPIRPGTDLYLALGMLHLIIRRGWVDEDYVRAHTVGPLLVRQDTGRFLRARNDDGAEMVWDDAVERVVPAAEAQRPALTGSYRVRGTTCRPAFDLLAEMVEPYTPALVAAKTGIPAERVEALAEEYATTKPARIYTLFGVDRWHHGATFGRLIATLAALTGNVGIPGGGAGVDGMTCSSLLVTDFTYPGGKRYHPVNPACLADQIITGKPYPIKGMWVAFSNWLNQWPDQNRMRERVLPELDLLVTCDMFMTETARWSDYVLPIAGLFERADIVRGPGPYVQYQPQIVPPPDECRSDFEVAAAVAQRLGHGDLFDRTPDEYLREMLAGVPELRHLSFDELREKGVLHTGVFETVAHAGSKFNTRTGRVEFYSERLLPFGRALPSYEPPVEADLDGPLAARYPLVCISERSPYRVHSSFSAAWWLRELAGRPTVMISPEDAEARGIKSGDRVRMFNDRGHVVLEAVVSRRALPGAVYVSEGWQSSDFISGHLQTLTHGIGNEANIFGPNCSFFDVLVEITREEGAE